MGYFPQWRVRQGTEDGLGQVISTDERLPWPQTIAMGLQHVVAMFGATVLAPLLMGFDPNLAIFMSGIGTLLFFVQYFLAEQYSNLPTLHLFNHLTHSLCARQ